jgi:3-oxoacyl-[acyl-carrier-protein] synthase III
MKAFIRAIDYSLPETVLSTHQLAEEFPDWSVEKIDQKTGISERHIAGPGQCSSDLGFAAAEALFQSSACPRESIDFLLLCTQSPDYFLPTTACLLQDRLGLTKATGALDFNLGCSGYIYGLGLAQGLIETGQASNVVLITAETYSKFIHPKDRSVRTIFGDAAAATWISSESSAEPWMGPYVYGTDGSGGPNLMVPAGAFRQPHSAQTALESSDESGNVRSADNLYMDGPEIFAFTMGVVPRLVRDLMAKASLGWEDLDLVVFHQANRYMLDHLRKSMRIPEEKFYLSFAHCGNTVSSTIPIALLDAHRAGRLRDGARVMLVGFGVGYSWGGTILRWRDAPGQTAE